MSHAACFVTFSRPKAILTLERLKSRLGRRSDLRFLLDPIEHPKKRQEPFFDSIIAADAMCSIDLRDLMRIAVLHRGQKQHREELPI